MAYDYEDLYANTPDALGAPNKALVRHFKKMAQVPLRVLDVGCGQGRDAVFIARLGHTVVAVDLAPSGIRDLEATAKTEGLPIKGVVADITEYAPEGMFDVIVIDRVLHMLGEPDRIAVLSGLLGHLSANGWLLIIDEAPNMAALKEVMAQSSHRFRTGFERRGYLFSQAT